MSNKIKLSNKKSKPVIPTDTLQDHYLKRVGELVNNAALCDAILFSAFKVLSGCEGEIAIAIYFASESLSSKKNIITRIRKAVGDDVDKEIIQRLFSAVEKAQNQRNELSHALLRISQEGEILTHNPRNQVQPKKTITGPYLDSLLKNSSLAFLEARKAFQELCQKHGKPQTISLG